MLPRQKRMDQVGSFFSFAGRRALFRYVGIQPPRRLATEGPTEARGRKGSVTGLVECFATVPL